MSVRKFNRKKKRRLTKEELKEIRLWFESSPQGQKPSIRAIARRYGVNQPSVVKSLGGWKGIRRGRPIPPPVPPVAFPAPKIEPGNPGVIEEFTQDLPEDVEKELRR